MWACYFHLINCDDKNVSENISSTVCTLLCLIVGGGSRISRGGWVFRKNILKIDPQGILRLYHKMRGEGGV